MFPLKSVLWIRWLKIISFEPQTDSVVKLCHWNFPFVVIFFISDLSRYQSIRKKASVWAFDPKFNWCSCNFIQIQHLLLLLSFPYFIAYFFAFRGSTKAESNIAWTVELKLLNIQDVQNFFSWIIVQYFSHFISSIRDNKLRALKREQSINLPAVECLKSLLSSVQT